MRVVNQLVQTSVFCWFLFVSFSVCFCSRNCIAFKVGHEPYYPSSALDLSLGQRAILKPQLVMRAKKMLLDGI